MLTLTHSIRAPYFWSFLVVCILIALGLQPRIAVGYAVDETTHLTALLNDTLGQEAYFKASNTDTFDNFGWSIAISGDTMVVGAPYEASNATGVNGDQANNNAGRSGAAYVFVRSAEGAWSQQAYLKSSNTDEEDFDGFFGASFGYSVAISGDTIVVGAPQEDSNATGVNGDQTNDDLPDAGAAYVFVRNSEGVWSQQAYLKASNTDILDYFGYSVAISGETIVVGALGESSNATGVNGDQTNDPSLDAGAAYVFVRSDGMWSQQAYLKASNTDAGDYFGGLVGISGETIVVGAPGESSNATGVNGDQASNNAQNAGAAYVFARSNGIWSQQAYLKASNTDADDYFGGSVAISGDTIVIGAPEEDSEATGVNGDQASNNTQNAGAAYVFVRSNGIWSQQSYLKASNTDAGDWFGYSVAISDNTIVVGAKNEDSNAIRINGDQTNNAAGGSGAAYIFLRNNETWTQQAYLKASNTDVFDWFGYSVAISGELIVVGALYEDSNSTGVNGDQINNEADASGAAYGFLLDTTQIEPPTYTVYLPLVR